MKTLMYSVYDTKVERYLTPFYMQTIGAALRAWKDVVNDPSTQFNKHPADYVLFEIGEYDDETGTVKNHLAPISKGTALEYLDSVPKQIGAAQ